MKIIQLIRSLFFKGEEKKEKPVKDPEIKRQNLISPDFIDYDGMGNQGRFPSRRKAND